MNKCALFIPRPGATSKMIRHGYIDTLRHLGWKVYVGNPKTKLCCRKWIEDYGIRLIMTSSRYGIRQLPIQVINDNKVMVIVDALPLNQTNSSIDGPYEFAHDDEPYLINEIHNVMVHTRLEADIWPEYMCGWESDNIDLVHLPVAGNIINALPSSCETLTDVAMVANFNHRQNIMQNLIEPLFKRLDLLGYSYQVFGDNVWQLAGLNYNGPLIGNTNELANVYATAKVCPNVHTKKQVITNACVNERSFMIPLCGGVQVSDNPVIAKYLGSHCAVAISTTDFMNKIIGVVENQSRNFEQIKDSVKHVADNHTYFNRLVTIFTKMGLLEFAEEITISGKKIAERHCWEINARLSASERGIPYEQKAIGTT